MKELTLQPKKQCSAITAAGKQCLKEASYGETCFSHSNAPEVKAKRHQIAILGGSHVSTVPVHKGAKIQDSRDLHLYLSSLLSAIAQGRMKVTSGNLKDITQLSKVFLETEMKSNILKRLDKIEEAKEQ